MAMKKWSVNNGVLFIADGPGGFVPSADDIFRHFVEDDQQWPGEALDESEIESLRFSKYPLQLHLTLQRRGEEEGYLAVNGSHRAVEQTFSDPEVLQAGHVIINDRWHALEKQSASEVAEFLAKNKVGLGDRVSLKVYLALQKAGADIFSAEGSRTALSFITELATVPNHVNATLYPYQLDGWRWSRFIMEEHLGGVLADEMGLGKTLQVISAIADPLAPIETPVLIIAPGSILENWIREFRKFAPHLRTLKHHGAARTGRPNELLTYDVVVTSYDAVVRDNSMFMMITWSVIVCDEAQYIKNVDSLRARSVKKLKKNSGLAVTGTPVENRLTDLWSIVDFALPGYLGKIEDFQKEFEDDLDGATRLERIASPIMLRRRVAEVAQDLPERIDIPQVVEFEENDAQQYDRIRNEILAESGASATLVSLTKLRMYCSHPWLLQKELPTAGDPAEFAKYSRLVDILDEIFQAGEKAILFTAYTAMTDILVKDIASRFSVFTGFIDGRLPIDDRQPMIDAFSANPDPALLVLNPRAGGSGLNITAANHVIHYTLEWNPAMEDQASARAYRRGQTRPVTVHRLFCAGTVEEVVDDRLARKRTISEAAVVGVRGDSDDYNDIVAALQRSPLSGATRK
jgi:SNF2 family DNA or RNA helicase